MPMDDIQHMVSVLIFYFYRNAVSFIFQNRQYLHVWVIFYINDCYHDAVVKYSQQRIGEGCEPDCRSFVP